ncbi:DUF721 domain-containing protein [Patescibacteria group bacterium]|nr:DUF721 domain-containing protein [Patescibacteria group bacterium]
MSFESFQKFVPRAINKYGISKEAHAAEICHYARLTIPELFSTHPEPEKNITPARYQDGEIVFNVSSPTWGQEVIMRKPKIIDEINKKAGHEVIKKLRTQLFS